MDEYSADEFGKYSSLSNLAVCSLVLALLSPLAFVSPLLLVIPVAAVACGALALGRIRTSGGSLTGGKLAYAAIALSVVCAVGSVIRIEVRDYLYVRQANDVAREWLELLLADRALDSLDLLSGSAKRQLFPPPDPGEPPVPFDPDEAADRLSDDSLVALLDGQRELGEIRFEQVDAATDTRLRNPHAILNYRVELPEGDAAALRMVLTRVEGPGMPARWLVEAWSLEGDHEGSHGHRH